MTIDVLRQKLREIDQEQVLRFEGELDSASRERLIGQLSAIDLASIPKLVGEYVTGTPTVPLPKDISPVKAYPHESAAPSEATGEQYDRAKQRGETLLAEGKVAAFLVAGGQGTRLGYDGPKGEYPVTPVKKKPLFEVFAEQLLAHGRDAGRPIPWYIMTSDINDAATRSFFETNDYFDYDKTLIRFFPQGMMPAFGRDGKMLLSAKDSLALSPDGHGGSLRALRNSGALADMLDRGIEHLSYFQVDNPMVHCIDPFFLGLHDLTGSEMSSKTIAKASSTEKVGNFCVGDGRVQVIEYSDLPAELAECKNDDGSLTFNAGSIAIHAVSVRFIERLTEPGSDLKLVWHRAEKKVPFIDENGTPVKPDKPNAIKLEQFVFDAIPLAKNAIVYETSREEEFSPVKNAEGADSPATSARDQSRRAARWLTAGGVNVPQTDAGEPDCTLEIGPLYASSAAQISKRAGTIDPIEAGTKVYFG